MQVGNILHGSYFLPNGFGLLLVLQRIQHRGYGHCEALEELFFCRHGETLARFERLHR